MALLKPFAGLRPQRHLAALVAAPPYDVLSSAEARLMARGKPWIFLHVNKPEIDLEADIDPHDERVYRKGAENLKRFIEEGVLLRDPVPSYYVYRQTRGSHRQTGLVALASVEEYERGVIRKHEHTRRDKEDDRVRHIDTVNAQVGPVFLTYRSELALNQLLEQGSVGEAEYDFIDDVGVRHEFWVVSDAALVAAIGQRFGGLPALYVADGHHRSAAALRVRDLRRKANSRHRGDEAYNYFLAVAFPHDQLQILAYNRLVRDLNGLSAEEFLGRLARDFEVRALAPGEAPEPRQPGSFGLFLAGRWHALRLREPPPAEPVSRLDVSLLQERILQPILGIGEPRSDPRLDFVGGVRGPGELEARVASGEHALAFALHPTAIEDLLTIADAGGVMPPKSTWFEPKLKSGLIIHPLD